MWCNEKRVPADSGDARWQARSLVAASAGARRFRDYALVDAPLLSVATDRGYGQVGPGVSLTLGHARAGDVTYPSEHAP
jgi:hypothetical protein